MHSWKSSLQASSIDTPRSNLILDFGGQSFSTWNWVDHKQSKLEKLVRVEKKPQPSCPLEMSLEKNPGSNLQSKHVIAEACALQAAPWRLAQLSFAHVCAACTSRRVSSNKLRVLKGELDSGEKSEQLP